MTPALSASVVSGFFLVALMAAYWMRFSEPIWLAVL
jgi:hypothetical protein